MSDGVEEKDETRDLPFLACSYQDDEEIPFAPDGNAPLISNCVEKVRGTRGRFQNLQAVRKTVIITTEPDVGRRDVEKRRLTQEAKILHSARHHHVIRLFHTYFQEENSDQLKFAVIMDRADANLQEYLRPGKPPNPQWFGCLTRAVHYIHSQGIRHRDIKPSNVLIKGSVALLADFGISQMGLGKTMPTTNLARNAARSRNYCAPEVEGGRTRGRSADIFSLGAVFLEMSIVLKYPDRSRELNSILNQQGRETPSYAEHVREVRQWIGQTLFIESRQNDLLSLCQEMLHPDRSERPSAERLDHSLSAVSDFCLPLRCNCSADIPIDTDASLIEACKQGSDEKVKRLLEGGARPDTIGAIHHAATSGSTLSVQALLDAGVSPDSRNSVQQTAMQCAARSGCYEVVRLLLERDVDVNARDENDQTALHGAAAQGEARIVKLLLEYNADVDLEDFDGQTAIHLAMRRRQPVIVGLLEHHSEDNDSTGGGATY